MDNPQKQLAAVCGLYCESCSVYIATTQDPKRLEKLATQFKTTPGQLRCKGCRSEEKTKLCTQCKMFACAHEKGIDFCVECDQFPCEELKQFQSAKPHRINLWKDFDIIKKHGWKTWLKQVKNDYTCEKCGAINSAYDLTCRICGADPSCAYVQQNGQAVKQYLQNL